MMVDKLMLSVSQRVCCMNDVTDPQRYVLHGVHGAGQLHRSGRSGGEGSTTSGSNAKRQEDCDVSKITDV